MMLSACSGGALDVAADSATGESCDGRADFWIVIQQEYLDRLGSARAVDLDPPTKQVTAVNEWAGTALFEHAREAETVDCSAEVRVGSPEICGRLDRLQSGGATGDLVLDRLRARCTP